MKLYNRVKELIIEAIATSPIVDAIKNNKIQLVINTGLGGETKRDGYEIRHAAIQFDIPYATTIAGALAMSRGISALKKKGLSVKSIQEYHG